MNRPRHPFGAVSCRPSSSPRASSAGPRSRPPAMPRRRSRAPAAAASANPFAVVGWVAVIIASVAGIGCVAAILGALFPRIAAATDRQARAAAPTTAVLVGSLLCPWASSPSSPASSHAGGGTAAGLAFLLLGVPAVLLLLAGSIATFPLLGERLLGARGPAASPLLPVGHRQPRARARRSCPASSSSCTRSASSWPWRCSAGRSASASRPSSPGGARRAPPAPPPTDGPAAP